MARTRFYVTDDPEKAADPQAVAFAKRLNQMLLRKGWSQADLTRAAQNHVPEGHEFKRHLPSVWLRGKHMPNGINLEILAKALGVTKEDLIPEGSATVVGLADRAVQFTMSTNGYARIKLDMEMPAEIAMKIMMLAQEAQKGQKPQT
jgi:hypothetical protein